MRKKQWFLLCACLAFLLALPLNASAAEKNLVAHRDTVVPEGQSVENVVIVGADVEVSGSVEDAVVVINGNLSLRHSAQIRGPVFVFGGRINQEPGAQVGENVFSITFDSPTVDSFLLGGFLLTAVWLLRFFLSLMGIAAATIIAIILGDRVEPLREIGLRSPGRAVLIGFVASLLLGAVCVLLLITIFGIPLAVLLAAIALVVFLVGLAVCGVVVGERLVDAFDYHRWQAALLGTVVIVALLNIPLLGSLLFLVLLWFSLGLVASWAGVRKRKPDAGD